MWMAAIYAFDITVEIHVWLMNGIQKFKRPSRISVADFPQKVPPQCNGIANIQRDHKNLPGITLKYRTSGAGIRVKIKLGKWRYVAPYVKSATHHDEGT